jgi:hypothetical protein
MPAGAGSSCASKEEEEEEEEEHQLGRAPGPQQCLKAAMLLAARCALATLLPLSSTSLWRTSGVRHTGVCAAMML